MNQYIPYRIFSYYEDILKLRRGEYVTPRFADLHTSNRCNQFCHGCAYANHKDGKMMSRKDHFYIVKELMDLGVKGFDFAGGGEPTTLPYLPDLLLYIHSRGGSFGIITNGSLLTDELMEIIMMYGTYIRISLEASNMRDFVRYKRVKKEQWITILENIQKLVYLKGAFAYHSHRYWSTDVSIKFSVGKSLRGPEHYVNGTTLGETLGVDRVQFKLLRHDPEELSQEEIEEEIQYGHLQMGGTKWEQSPVPKPCWLNPLHVVVDHTGNAYICCYYYFRGDEHIIGNMLEKPIKEFWLGNEHKAKLDTIDPEKCALVDCKFFRHHQVVYDYVLPGKCEFL